MQPVRVSDDGRYFVDGNGRPIFWMGTTQWQLFRDFRRPEAELILRKTAENGFVFAQVMLLGVGDVTQPNVHGERGWTSADPLTPNEAYFRNVDAILEIAESYGVSISMTVYHQRWRGLITAKNARAWALWIAARYRDTPNIVWSMTPEAKPEWLPVMRELVAGLREGDGGSHLVTFKPDPAPHPQEFGNDEPWLDFHAMQVWTWVEAILPMVNHYRALVPTRPVLMGEAAYEAGTEYDFEVTPLWVRRQAYYSYLLGASHTYGHNDSWRVLPTWKQALDAPGARQLGVLKRVLTSLPEWWRLVPDRGLLASGGETSGRLLTLAARHPDNRWIAVYCSQPTTVSVRVDALPGTLPAVWIDPRNSDRIAAQGERQFATPAGWEDALLVIAAP